MKVLKPYYKRNGKYFFRKGKLKMTVTHNGVGHYVFDGDVIPNVILKLDDKTEFAVSYFQ